MSIESEARAEAERRWPALNPGDVELTYPRGALRATARKAFEAGAVWASEQADRESSNIRANVRNLTGTTDEELTSLGGFRGEHYDETEDRDAD